MRTSVAVLHAVTIESVYVASFAAAGTQPLSERGKLNVGRIGGVHYALEASLRIAETHVRDLTLYLRLEAPRLHLSELAVDPIRETFRLEMIRGNCERTLSEQLYFRGSCTRLSRSRVQFHSRSALAPSISS